MKGVECMDYKSLAIGVDNFKDMINKDYYYVDKTNLIQKILDGNSKVTLFTRPRRFGKSLNLSMLQYYFERNDEDRSCLFEGLKIADAGEKYKMHQGKYPLISLNFKEAKQSDFDLSYSKLRENIRRQYEKYAHILELDVLNNREREKYLLILERKESRDVFTDSLAFLCMCLEKAYGEKAVILLDEYDVPLENAYFRGYYEQMIDVIRSLLSVALKTNDSLAFAVITGCLRISKESIFTGLNNLEIVSIRNEYYDEFFGFTQGEVEDMLSYYGKGHHIEQIREWYDGYLFGGTEVYNPWSLINHVKQLGVNDASFPIPYWSNTSSNSIVRDLVRRADRATKAELEVLIKGGTIEKCIREDITYEDIYVNSDNLWNFLFFTGYLRKVSERLEYGDIYVTMRIPNQEVKNIYNYQIMEWCNDQINQKDLTPLYRATFDMKPENMREEINQLLMSSISYHDGLEAYYHGFVSGIYLRLEDYNVISNRESGNGRPDLILKPLDYRKQAYVLEFKVAKTYLGLEDAAEKALEQCIDNQYAQGLQAEGFADVVSYGIGFCEKACLVKMR